MNLKSFIILILLVFVTRFIPGVLVLKEIPKSYGWYEIAKNISSNKTTKLEYAFPNKNGEIKMTYNSVRPPLYLLVYVVIIGVFNESVLAYLLIHLVLVSITVLIMYRLLLELYKSTAIALFGSIIFCVYPHYLTRTFNASEDNLYILLVVTALYFILKYIRTKNFLYFIFVSIFLGLAALTRITILTFVGLLFLSLFLYERNFKHLIVSTGFFALFLLPLIISNYSAYGKFILSDNGGSRFWVANNHYIAEIFPGVSIDRIEEKLFNDLEASDVSKLNSLPHPDKEKYLKAKAVQFIKNNPELYLKALYKKFVSVLSFTYNPLAEGKNLFLRQFVHSLSYIPLLILGIIGFFYLFKISGEFTLVLILFYFSLIILSLLYWSHTRHTIPYHIVFIISSMSLVTRMGFLEKIRGS